MAGEITMPKLSDTMEEGKILHWLKHPGDAVRRGDALAEVETDKADMVLESFEDGVITEIKLKEGESAAVGTVIALMAPARQESEQVTRAQAHAVPESARGDGEAAAQPVDGERAPAGESARTARSATLRSVEPQEAGEELETEAAKARVLSESETFEQARPGDDIEAKTGARPEREQSAEAVRVHAAFGARLSARPSVIIAPPPEAEPTAPTQAGEHEASAEPRPIHRFKASPLARRAAEEAGVDLAHVRGSGPDGRITKRDVDKFLREQQLFRQRRLVAPREGTLGSREEMSKMRQTIAQRMAASKREIPHFYVTAEVDMEEAVRLKESLEAAELFDEDITYNDIVVKACALALLRYPRLNASYENGGLTIHPDVNIGIAVAIEDGLIVPVLRECQRLSLPEIARAAHRLVAKASQGGFTSAELSGGTFTISNMGMLGVEHFAAVIVPPQAAILAVSAIKERPVVRHGQIVVGKTMMVTISCDHRIVDGVVAGRFLQELKRFLENPASLLLQ
jgi:pyruvate dehydrogenase E2 component (dihydrolipoamide acetyltransferase)